MHNSPLLSPPLSSPRLSLPPRPQLRSPWRSVPSGMSPLILKQFQNVPKIGSEYVHYERSANWFMFICKIENIAILITSGSQTYLIQNKVFGLSVIIFGIGISTLLTNVLNFEILFSLGYDEGDWLSMKSLFKCHQGYIPITRQQAGNLKEIIRMLTTNCQRRTSKKQDLPFPGNLTHIRFKALRDSLNILYNEYSVFSWAI